MKNHFSKLALTAGVLLALTLGCEEKESGKSSSSANEGLSSAETAAPLPKEDVASCKDGEKVKLLESINVNKQPSKKFEYDDNNRIVKIYQYRYEDGKIYSTRTITYNSDDLITVDTKKIVKKGKIIIIESDTLTLNEDGYVVEDDHHFTYQYHNGNMIGLDNGAGDSNFNFDDKKSPFANTATPKWLLQYVLEDYTFANKNNIVGYDFNNGEVFVNSVYKYEYDSEGFPTKKTESNNVGDVVESDRDDRTSTTITNYTYRTAACKRN